MVKIWVNDELLDMPGDSKITIEWNSSLFENELVRGEYSYPFQIPMTEHNRKIFGNIQELSFAGAEISYAVVFEKLGQQRNGVLYIDKIDFDFTLNTGALQCSLVTDEGSFFSKIKDKKLSEINFDETFDVPEYDEWEWVHSNLCLFASDITMGEITDMPFCFPMMMWEDDDWEENNWTQQYLPHRIINYWVSSVGGSSGGTYPYDSDTFAIEKDVYAFCILTIAGEDIDAPGGWDPDDAVWEIKYYTGIHNGWAFNRLVPMFYSYYILQKIFEEYGVTVEGSLLSDTTFLKEITLNNQVANKWSYDSGDTPPKAVDLCTEINPASHMPDVLISDWLNDLSKKFGFIYVFDGNTVYLKQKNQVAATSGAAIPEEKINPLITKLLSTKSEIQQGINLRYTIDSRTADLVKNDEPNTLTGSVEDDSDLPGGATEGQIYLIKNEGKFYRRNAIGTWSEVTQNLVDYNGSTGGMEVQLTGQAVPADTFTVELQGFISTTSRALLLPVVNLPIGYVPDPNVGIYPWSYSTILDSMMFKRRGEMGNYFMLYHGLQTNSAGNFEYPFASWYNYGPDSAKTKIADWHYGWWGGEGLVETFYSVWMAAIVNMEKVGCTIYFTQNELVLIAAEKYYPALHQRFVFYKVTSTEMYNGIAKCEVYKLGG